jgi:hypothetical protein
MVDMGCSNHLEVQSVAEALELFKMAEFFQVDSMQFHCEKFISEEKVTAETVCHIWNHSADIRAGKFHLL